MALTGKLADYFIQFSEKGAELLKRKIGEIKTSLESIQTGAEAVSRKASIAFASLTGTVGGFVTAGLAGSAQMGAMTFQMERLSRGIAGIFLPEFEKAIEVVGRAADLFRSLTRDQQDNIKRWIEAAAVGLGMAIVLPKVFAGLTLVASGFKAVAASIAAGFSMTGVGALLPIIGGIATAVLALATSARVGREGLQGLQGILQPLQVAFNKLEAIIGKIDWAGISANLEPVIAAFGRLTISIVSMVADVLPDLISIASDLLVPAFNLLADVVETVAGLVNRQTLAWIAAGATFITVIKIIPTIIGAIQSMITVLKSLTIAQVIQQALAGPQGWISLAIGITAAGAALGAYFLVADAAEKRVSKLATANLRLPKPSTGAPGSLPTPVVHGPEALTATLTRLQQEALKRDYQALIRDHTKRTADNTGVIIERLNRLINTKPQGFRA